MLRFSILASALLLPLLGAAQGAGLYTDAREGTLNDRYALGYFMTPREGSSTLGNVFLLPGWAPGQLLLNGNSKPLDAPLKYDLYNLELRAKRATGDSVTVPLARIKEFSLANRRFACYPAPGLPTEVGGGCGEVLYESPAVQCLKFERKTLENRAASTGTYATTTTVPVLELHTYYYLRWADGRFVPLKLRRASLEQALGGHPAAVQALKSYKGNLSTEQGLAAAMKELEPLLSK